jgi:class 3 adenylate cyclase
MNTGLPFLTICDKLFSMNKTGFSYASCRKCLYSSLSVADMIRFARMACPDYDIYKRSGYPMGHPMSTQDAATWIVDDMQYYGRYLDLVEVLVQVDSQGYMGRRYVLKDLDAVVEDVIRNGYSFDKTTGSFYENQQERITNNWGRLLEGEERIMAVMRLDIARNSIMVRENPKNLIDKTYNDIRKIVTRSVVSRLGRVWSWEGDGSLAAFFLSNYSRMAIFTAMEILSEMFFYNKFDNPLNSDIKLRLAVHSGSIQFSNNEAEYQKADIVRKAIILESKAAAPNSLVISESLAVTQDQALLDIFSNQKQTGAEKYRVYQVYQENEMK